MGRKLLGALVGVVFAVAAPTAAAEVVVNEVDCDDSDWVELLNTGAAAEDISGWRLTDAPIGSGSALVFPAGTEIAAGGRLVFERNQPGGFTFGISCADTIRLADATPAVVDQAVLPDIDFDLDTWGRVPDGDGELRQTFPTKGAPNAPSPSGVDEAAALFDPNAVADIDIDLPPASVAALSDPATWEDYQDGTIELQLANGDDHGPLDVGVRLKGGLGSFRTLDGKAAFKVRFPHEEPGARLLGLRTLTLNNMVQDPSMVHERLAYELFRAMAVPAPRTGYARVSVNDELYGLYLNVETADDVSLPLWGFPSTRHLYEGAYGSDVNSPTLAIEFGEEGGFELDEGSESDASDLEALVAAVEAGSPADFSDRVSSLADLDEMARMWAVEKYSGHWDGYAGGLISDLYPNNFYLHSDASGRFVMLPWGADQTWVLPIAFDGPGDSILFSLCLADPSCAAAFSDAVRATRTAALGLDLDSLAVGTASVLAPAQPGDREHTPEEIAAGLAATRAFIAQRPADAAAWLPATPPTPSTTPTVAAEQPGKKKCKRLKSKRKRKKCRRKRR